MPQRSFSSVCIAAEIRKDVDTTVHSASQAQLDIEKSAVAQETAISTRTSTLLDSMKESVDLGEEQVRPSQTIDNDLSRALNPLKRMFG